MKALRSVIIAFSMYSKIPVPSLEWREEDMRHVMAAFPLVGVVTGALVCLWGWLCGRLWLSPLIRGSGFFLVPLAVTGGIHIDGLCDTFDALGSHGSREKKLEIMNDPRMGAFGAIGLVAYSICYAALSSELLLGRGTLLCFGFSFILTRAMSGLGVVFLSCAKGSGLARTFADTAARRTCGILLCVTALIAATVMMYFGGLAGAVAVIFAISMFIYYAWSSKRNFGGITGDLAGWFLQLCEILILLALVTAQVIAEKLL